MAPPAWNAGFSRHAAHRAAEDVALFSPHGAPSGGIPLVSGMRGSASARAVGTDAEERTMPRVKVAPCAALMRSACRLKPALQAVFATGGAPRAGR